MAAYPQRSLTPSGKPRRRSAPIASHPSAAPAGRTVHTSSDIVHVRQPAEQDDRPANAPVDDRLRTSRSRAASRRTGRSGSLQSARRGRQSRWYNEITAQGLAPTSVAQRVPAVRRLAAAMGADPLVPQVPCTHVHRSAPARFPIASSQRCSPARIRARRSAPATARSPRALNFAARSLRASRSQMSRSAAASRRAAAHRDRSQARRSDSARGRTRPGAARSSSPHRRYAPRELCQAATVRTRARVHAT